MANVSDQPAKGILHRVSKIPHLIYAPQHLPHKVDQQQMPGLQLEERSTCCAHCMRIEYASKARLMRSKLFLQSTSIPLLT